MTIFWERCWMIHGIDTDLLVAVEIYEHPHHGADYRVFGAFEIIGYA